MLVLYRTLFGIKLAEMKNDKTHKQWEHQQRESLMIKLMKLWTPLSETCDFIWIVWSEVKCFLFSLQGPEQIQRSSEPAERRIGDQGENSGDGPSGRKWPSLNKHRRLVKSQFNDALLLTGLFSHCMTKLSNIKPEADGCGINRYLILGLMTLHRLT